MNERLLLLLPLIVLGLFGCGACSSQTSDPAPVIRPQPGAELCDEVCAHIGPVTEQTPDALNCPEGLPVPVNAGGTVDCEEGSGLADCITCTEFCVEQHQKGIYWNTECMQSVSACEEIETVCNDGGGV
jgi:hypothetical protein